MHASRRARTARPLTLFLTALLAATLAVPLASAQDVATGGGAEDASPLFSAMLMGSQEFEAGDAIRVEISVANRSAAWATVTDAATLAANLSLRTAAGKTIAPREPGRVGAAKTDSLGPGGFLGIALDARELFPALSEPGRYTLVFSPQGARERTIDFSVLPAFDPSKDYWLELRSSAGTIGIDLDEKNAPGAVRGLARLAWSGALDGAVVPRLQSGFAMQIAPTKREASAALPFEQTSSQLLAGTVILEPRLRGNQRVNTSSLVVLLAPQTTEPGSATAVGHVAEGRDTLDKLAGSPTTGADGSPPWQPRTPIVFETVTVKTR